MSTGSDQPSFRTGLPRLLIFVSTGGSNASRRRSLRRSWFQYIRSPDSPLDAATKASVEVTFVGSKGDFALEEEAAREGDIMLLDAPEGYGHLWRKSLVFLKLLVDRRQGGGGPGGQDEGGGAPHPQYVMHADDDSFIRLDLLLPLLRDSPRERFYWGYVWDGTGNRRTEPIRNTRNKSHMPSEQYPLDYYPPFCSGCGFILSWDLVLALTQRPLPDYRLLDPPFGIHLCGPLSEGYLVLDHPVVPTHDDRVRPYRAIPIFHPDTIVQHYLRPEEMKPFYDQAQRRAEASAAAVRPTSGPGSRPGDVPGPSQGTSNDNLTFTPEVAQTLKAEAHSAPDLLYSQLVEMGLLRR